MFKEAVIYLPPPAPERTPVALQFSNLREDKKYQETMGLIENNNLLLRQVPLGWMGGGQPQVLMVAGREAAGWEPLISDGTLFSKSGAPDTHWEAGHSQSQAGWRNSGKGGCLWEKEGWESGPTAPRHPASVRAGE